mgnify:CR=1 FL=1
MTSEQNKNNKLLASSVSFIAITWGLVFLAISYFFIEDIFLYNDTSDEISVTEQLMIQQEQQDRIIELLEDIDARLKEQPLSSFTLNLEDMKVEAPALLQQLLKNLKP